MNKAKNNRFTSSRNGSTYICECCGKRTRETGHEESGLALCALCLWRTYAENSVYDHVSEGDIRTEMLREARTAATVQECQQICSRAVAIYHN